MIIELTAPALTGGSPDVITGKWDTDLTVVIQSNDFSIQTDSFSAAYLPADLENMKNVAVAYWQSKRNLPGAVVTKEGNRPKTLVYTDADGVVLTLTHNYVYDVNSDMCFLLNNETIKITK